MEDCEDCKECKGYERQERRERPIPRSRGLGGDTSVERASAPRIGVHGVRHTHAIFVLLDGVPLMLVSKRLGHAKFSITLDTYSHILPGFERRAVESIGAALFG
jgi:integrase